MASDRRTLILEIVSDVDKAAQGIDSVDQKLGAVGTTARRLAGGLIGAQVVSELGDFAAGALELASGAVESRSKLETLLGPLSAASEQWAANAFNIGLSEAAALEAAGTFANIGNTIGLSREESAAWSTELPALAADLASFNNTTVDEAINAIGSALRGEAEPIRQFGVLLDAATLSSIAYANGIAEAGEQLTPAQKAQAAYLAIMEQTTVAQGDAERTADGWANQQRRLAAQWANFQQQIGEVILPLMEALAGWVLDSLIPAFSDFGDLVGEQWPAIWETVEPIITGLQELVSAVLDNLTGAWEEYGDEVVAVLGWFLDNVGEVADAVLRILGGVIDFLTGVFTGDWELAWEGVLEIAGGLLDWFLVLPSALLNLLPTIASGLASFGAGIATGIANAFIGAWNRLDIGFEVEIPSWVPGLGGRSWGVSDLIPDVPTLHSGGITTRAGLANLDAAEVVTPLRDFPQGATIQINVDATLAQDPVAVGAAVVDAIREYETVAGPVLAVA